MSYPYFLLCYVDSEAWGDTVTLTQKYQLNTTQPYDPDLSPTDPSNQEKVVKTGSATFTYQRATLESLATDGSVPCGSVPAPGKEQFVAYRLASGVPGWGVVFGSQDPVSQAYTTVTTPPPNPDYPNDPNRQPTTTYQDANASPPSFTCAETAPGMFTDGFTGTLNGVLSNSPGLTANYPMDSDGTPIQVAPTSYTVEQIVPGSAATTDPVAPAVLPVYLVTLPPDVGFVLAFSLTHNGVTDGGTLSSPAFIQDFLFNRLGGFACFLRSQTSALVQLPNVTDTLAAGQITYVPTERLASSCILSGDFGTVTNTVTLPIGGDVFSMAGQSFDSDSDPGSATVQTTTGYSVQVQC